MHQIKGILLQIILTKAALKQGYHGTGMGSHYLINDIMAWSRNNYNTHIDQYLPN